MWYFYPRPPQGGRPGQAPASVCGRMISIHALRKEGDTATAPRTRRSWYFYPRPPQGGRRGKAGNQYRHHAISIHALRKEGDPTLTRTTPPLSHFYPRPPRGGRRLMCFSCEPQTSFLSTPSARRATQRKHRTRQAVYISIHALREEGDSTACTGQSITWHFYPRPPRGGRPL